MRVGNIRHLTYCSNIHPGETWTEVQAALAHALPRVREQVGFAGPMAIGLRLSAEAAVELDRPGAMAALRGFLALGDYYIPTLNGFPYGAFHGQRVKEQVYRPDWRDPARVTYSNQLGNILSGILAGTPCLSGCISTVPGAFRADVTSDEDRLDIAKGLLRHVAHLVALRDRTGVTVSVAIEPEPSCFLETVTEAVAFMAKYLLDRSLITYIAAETRVPMDVDVVRRHIGLCLDACHMAVEFEDPADALLAAATAGIPIRKVQVSSALQLDERTPAQLVDSLAPFAEDTYLHQVVERRDGALTHYVDLPEALGAAIEDPSTARRDWRVHFHVPIFLDRMRHFGTTQAYLGTLLDLVRQPGACDCFEVETYTWDVLPDEYRTMDVCSAIARELTWARERLEA